MSHEIQEVHESFLFPGSTHTEGSISETGQGGGYEIPKDLVTVVDTEGNLYRSNKIIGVTPGGVTVYKTREIPIVALVVVYPDEQPHRDNLLADIKRVNHCNHWNILNIKKSFVSDGNEVVCLMPLHEIVSLRNLMRRHSEEFDEGFPEEIIAVALRETLYGLSRIHDLKQVHKRINAGNVYYDLENEAIRLAYGASLYDRQDDIDLDNELSDPGFRLTALCEVGAAPEVFDKDHAPESYSVKSDIWLIGILALELAYGELKVTSRQQLNNYVGMIRSARRLPSKEPRSSIGGQKKTGNKVTKFIRETMKETGNKMNIELPRRSPNQKEFLIEEYDELENKKKGVMSLITGKVKMPDAVADKGKGMMNVIKNFLHVKSKEKKEDLSFSKAFGEMVAQCLATNPNDRPDVRDLLMHKFFNKSRTVRYFRDIAVDRDEILQSNIKRTES